MVMPRVARLVFILFVGIGTITLESAGLTYLRTRTFVRTAGKADGTVIENVGGDGGTGNRSRTYHPRVRFHADGRDFVFVSGAGSSAPSFQVNDAVRVFYDPKNPAEAKIDSFGELWMVPSIVASLGVVCGMVGVGQFLWVRRVRRKDVLETSLLTKRVD
jgi:hypothetical protein